MGLSKPPSQITPPPFRYVELWRFYGGHLIVGGEGEILAFLPFLRDAWEYTKARGWRVEALVL